MALTKNIAFFTGFDSSGAIGFWVTDGTVAGTSEIGGVGDLGVIGANPHGLDSQSTLTAFHTAFTGALNTNNDSSFFISDGTAAGTIQVGGNDNQGIAGAAVGFGPQGFTWYRGKLLFSAYDNLGFGLWITDGTAAGTTEIGGELNHGVSHANPLGLFPSRTIVFNGKAYFSGLDATNFGGLWVTDGTAAGTTEIGGLGGIGIVGAAATGLDPFTFVVASGRLFFTGKDASNAAGLWVSDGTAAGTTEIGGLADQGVSGASATGFDSNAAIQLNGNVVFQGLDAGNGSGLWISDGTAADTFELGGLKNQGIVGANANGLAPGSFVRLGNKLLFNAFDSRGLATLWVTDGTVGGTTEIGGLRNQGIAGANTLGFHPRGFAVLGDKVLFSAIDSNGHTGLWITDGTAEGTTELGGLQGIPGAAAGGLKPLAIAAPFSVTATGDFNGDFYSDVLWRTSSGGLADWSMNAGSIVSAGALTMGGVAVNPDASWSVAAIADFDGNGQADVLWRNSNGALADWAMNGRTIVSANAVTLGGVAVNPGASWSIIGTGDFDGDGSADILWRNTSGQVTLWQMNGSSIVGSGDVTIDGVAVRPDASWSVAGTGDFDGDGKKDMLWRNTDGTVVEWTMNGATVASAGVVLSGGLPIKPDASWSVAGVGDFDGDGNADILWRNASGALTEWLMSGTTIVGSADVTANGSAIRPDATWHIVEVGDFNGDGQSDILWRNDNGALAEWLMNGTAIGQSLTPTSNGAVVSPDATWSTQAKPTVFG